MVKTKRSTARTALFASASLVLAARGADAAIGFTEGSGATHAFVADTGNTVTLSCANLYFNVATGALVDGDTGAAGVAGGTTAKGYAQDIGATPTTFDDCQTAPGYYLHTRVTSAADGTGLTIFPAPANFYAAGTEALDVGDVFAVAPSAITDDDGWNDVLTACPYGGTTTAAGQDALADCTPKCGSGLGAEANSNTCRCAANYYGTPVDANGLTEGEVVGGCTKCPYAGTAAAGTTALSTCAPVCGTTGTTKATGVNGVCACNANYYGTPLDANGATVLALSAASGCTACPSETPQSVAGSNKESKYCTASLAQAVANAVGKNTEATTCEELWFTADGQLMEGGAGRVSSTAVHLAVGGAHSDDLDNCETKPGFYLVAKANDATATSNGPIIAQSPANWIATGGEALEGAVETFAYQPADLLQLTTDDVETLLASKSSLAVCSANSNSVAGSTICTCDDGYIPLILSSGDLYCAPFSVTAASAAASPTAAAPTADSAGASTPIAVALAAAAAVPLLL